MRYTVSDLSKISKLSRVTIAAYIKSGLIKPCEKIGLRNIPVFDEKALQAILNRLKNGKHQTILPKDKSELLKLLRK